MSGDPRAARRLAGEKAAFRGIEAWATAAHLARLRAGEAASTEAGALHLDSLRDLKLVNAHLVAAAAYPVLQEKSELLTSRPRGGPGPS